MARCGTALRFFLFDAYPIGTILTIGTDSVEITGAFGGVADGVVFLTNARIFSNIGTPVGPIRTTVRIPLNMITFVSQP